MGEKIDQAAKKAALGSVKEALGKVIGNERVEAEGAAEKAAGKAEGRKKDTSPVDGKSGHS